MFNRKMMVALLVGLVGSAFTTSAIAADTPVRVAGKLSKIEGKTLTITTTADNETKDTIITCNDATRVGRDGDKSAVKFTELKVGQSVRAYYTKATNIAVAVIIAKPNP